MNRYVIDVSVAAKWVFDEPDAPAAVALLHRQPELYAPDFLYLEFANICWKKHRRENVTSREVSEALNALQDIRITLRPTNPLLKDALRIAISNGRTVYDCVYLALAEAMDVPMVTADRRLVNALAGTPLAGRAVWLGDVPTGNTGGEGGGRAGGTAD